MNEELEFLQWFYDNCDFGPASGDVFYLLQKKYEKETGKEVPENYRLED